MGIILSRDAQKFIAKLESKQAKQVALKIKELERLGHLNDSKKLKGSIENVDYYRVDIGEFRVIYRLEHEDIYILLVGKRNDDEVYKLFKRKMK